jgi:hypothetical protein
MDELEKKNDSKGIPWHQAFFIALQGTLLDYSADLEFLPEHPLNTEPLRIDIIVVKKRPEAVIKRQIAEIFRKENIFEYKRPRVSLSVNEFHKAFARANIYKALTDVDIADLTLSFVVASHPRELFRHLREKLGYEVEETHPGIFVVTGAMMPIQVINSTKLSDAENIWLRNLNRNLPEKDLSWVRRLERKYGKLIDLGAYLFVVITANQDKLSKEDLLMLTTRTRQMIEEIGWGEQWRQKYIEKGIEKGKLEDAQAMFAEGDSLEKIARVTKIPPKTLKEKLRIQ